MIERQIELGRRQQKRKKMRKLKTKLGTTTGADREKVLAKIKRISPWWTEASLTQKQFTPKAANAAPKKERTASKPKSDGPGQKGPPKPKAAK